MSYLALAKAALSRLRATPVDAETLAQLLEMPLDVFAREGQPVELRVPWWPATLFLVPDMRHAEALWREGITRERGWTAGEADQVMGECPVLMALSQKHEAPETCLISGACAGCGGWI